MELSAYRSYRGLDFPINFWRTKSGLEVDFILGSGEQAVEVKGTSSVDSKDLRSLRAFSEEFSPGKTILVCNEPAPRKAGPITILPWRKFLYDLWTDRIIK